MDTNGEMSGQGTSNLIRAREADVRGAGRKAWDTFVLACGGSVRSTDAHIRAWGLKHFVRSRARRIEVFAGSGAEEIKIAQCAVGLSAKGRSVYLDRVLILPGYQDSWADIMAAILKCCGARTYEYGWEMNVEPPREGQLGAIPGVTIDIVTPLVVQAIDFAEWPTWDDFMRGIRKGARQSAQFARRDIPDLAVKTYWGRTATKAISTLASLRLQLSSRKMLGLNAIGLIVSYVGWMLLCPEQTVARIAMGNGRRLAAYFGTEFGGTTYYLESASVPNNKGVSCGQSLEPPVIPCKRRPQAPIS